MLLPIIPTPHFSAAARLTRTPLQNTTTSTTQTTQAFSSTQPPTMGKSKDKGAVSSSSKKKNPKEELLAAAGGGAEGDNKKGECVRCDVYWLAGGWHGQGLCGCGRIGCCFAVGV